MRDESGQGNSIWIFLEKKNHIPYDENCCDSNNSVCVAVMVALCCEMWNIHLGNVAHHGPGSDPALAWE